MRQFLTSNGISNDILQEAFHLHFSDIKGAKVALLYTILEEGDELYLEKYHQELASLGLTWLDINISENEVDLESIRMCEAYYVCGGNTFYILSRLKATKLFQLLIDNIRIFNKPYFGASAGSIIAGNEISIAGVGENGDTCDINLTDTSGLAISGYTIFPHYTDEDETAIAAWEEKNKTYALRLSDGEAMLINDTTIARY